MVITPAARFDEIVHSNSRNATMDTSRIDIQQHSFPNEYFFTPEGTILYHLISEAKGKIIQRPP